MEHLKVESSDFYGCSKEGKLGIFGDIPNFYDVITDKVNRQT